MDAKLKREWIKALRSGQFKQARGQLRNGEAYCCLGVLCTLAGLPISEDGRAVAGGIGQNYGPIWEIIAEGPARTVAEMNDGYGGLRQHSFAEIADYIEENL